MVGLAAVLLTAGCGDDSVSGASEYNSGVAPSTTITESSAPTAGGSMAQLQELAKALQDRRSAELRTCMADEGFPQLMQAEQLTSQRSPQATSDVLRIDPLESGPYTKDQARRFGMVGSVILFERPQPGMVISRDDAYDEALQNCKKKFSVRAGQDVDTLLSSFTELGNTMRDEFLQATERDFTRLLTSRLDCVRAQGYPQLEPDAALTSDSFSAMLTEIGIKVNEKSSSPPPEPRVQGGRVVVVPPAESAEYRPTAEEIAFSLAYVKCADEVSFVERLDRLQTRARGVVVGRHSVELTALGQGLRSAVRRLG